MGLSHYERVGLFGTNKQPTHEPILIIFDRNFNRKASNQKMLYFPSALQLHCKRRKHENRFFSLKRCITVLPDINLQSVLDFLNTVDSQLKLMLLYQSINQSINQFIEQKDRSATYIDMHEHNVGIV